MITFKLVLRFSNGDTASASESEAVGGGTEGSIQSINTTPSAGA